MLSTSGIELVSDYKPQHSQDPDDSNSESTSAIAALDPIVDVYSASAHGDLDKLRKLVGEGQTVSVSDGNGYYALQWAVLNNFPDCARFIIERNGDVHALDNNNQTALHWGIECPPWSLTRLGARSANHAAYKGHADTVRLLLFRGDTIRMVAHPYTGEL